MTVKLGFRPSQSIVSLVSILFAAIEIFLDEFLILKKAKSAIIS